MMMSTTWSIPALSLRSAEQASLQANGNPVNDTFSVSSQLDLSGVATGAAETLAVLPCRTFTFLAGIN